MSYPSTKNNTGCSTCKFYSMIDSGYGWCTKNPPQPLAVQKRFRIFFIKVETVFVYPEVPWNLKTCGDYKSNGQRQPDLRCVEPGGVHAQY